MLTHAPTATALARVERLGSLWAKGRGVLGRTILPSGTGVWLPGVASVHTVGVRFPLDLLFLDKNFCTLRVCQNVPPGRLYIGARGAFHTVELGADTLACLSSLQPGDLWVLSPE